MFSGNFTSAEWSGQKEESGEGEGRCTLPVISGQGSGEGCASHGPLTYPRASTIA